MTKSDKSIAKFMKRIELFKKDHKLDLSSGEDLVIAIMNLISLEEHFFFTGAKTDKHEYYDLLNEVREIRKNLLKKIVKNTEGETWGISKHLLAGSMRLMEVGTKYSGQHKDEEAKEYFSKAYKLYRMFWKLNLKLSKDSKMSAVGANKIIDDKNDKDLDSRLNSLVDQLIDCCEE